MTDSAEKPVDERDPTTVSTRVWAANEISAACDMIVAQPGLLSPDLVAHARAYGPKDGGMPRWLVHGLAARHFRQWLEQRVAELGTQEIAELAAMERARVATEPATKQKRGSR